MLGPNGSVESRLVVLCSFPRASPSLGAGRGSRGRHGGDPSRAFLRELDLTEEQRQQMHTLARAIFKRDVRACDAQMRNALNEAIENGEDEGALRQHAYELGMAEGDAAVERARTHAQMIHILDRRTAREIPGTQKRSATGNGREPTAIRRAP